MTSILMTFTNVSWNKGAAAQVFTFVEALRNASADVKFVLLSHCEDLDRTPAAKLDIELAGLGGAAHFRMKSLRLLVCQLQLILWFFVRKSGINAKWLIDNDVARAYAEANIVADFSGDSYRDWPGGISLAHNVNLFAARILNKPIVLVSQSIGPFRWYSRWLSRRAFNSADLIYIREKRSRAILRDLKVTSRIALAPDIAFMLSPYGDEHLARIRDREDLSNREDGHPVFGISTSNLLARLGSDRLGYDYLQAMTQIVEYLHTTYGATVLLIPHEMGPGRDDRVISQALADGLRRPPWLKVIRGDYDPSELKTLIGSLDLLLAARLHAGIAGLSSNVPTILLSWSHKYLGTLEEIGIPQYVWDGTGGIASLERLCDAAIKNRESIVPTLRRYNSSARERVTLLLQAVLRLSDEPLGLREMADRSQRSPSSQVVT